MENLIRPHISRRWPTRGFVALVGLALATSATPAAAEVDANSLLQDLAARYSWTPIEADACIVQIDVRGDTQSSWHVVPLDGGDVDLRLGSSPEAGFTCELDTGTLDRLYRGELSGITAAGKDDVTIQSPVEILPGTQVPEDAGREALGPVFHFLTHFFNAEDPERIRLDRTSARPLHGAHMVGLYYHPGFRSAWYSLVGDERLNGEGDTTPYPQAFVVIQGSARIQLGRRWFDIGTGESIYVPAGTLHAVESKDGGEVKLLWMAWGGGA